MEDAGQRIVTELLRGYYKTAHGLAPDRIEEREFGFGTFGKRVAFRHAAFKTASELEKYLAENAPLYVNCSSAYYKLPDARPMERKQWLGSELIFDIDSTDLKTSCKLEHGPDWVCEKCLDAVKEEALKLIEKFLINDFGYEQKEISINFSGNRGYHVRVHRQSTISLDAGARAEVCDYIIGNGLEIGTLFPELGMRGKLLGPALNDGGWRKKIAAGFYKMIDDRDTLMESGVDKETVRKLWRNKSLVEMGLRNGNWDMIRMPRKAEVIPQIVQKIIERESARIDKNVTADPGHLARLPNSVNGTSGLVASKIGTIKELESFDPLIDSVAFKQGRIKVIASMRNRLSLNGEEFGPFENKAVTLPTGAAVYLYLKGLANIIGIA